MGGSEEIVDMAGLMDRLKEIAKESDGKPIAGGTFAFYAMKDGGVMVVSEVLEGPMAGIRHIRVTPAILRLVSGLASGGGPVSRVKAMMGRGK
jgi:hypothetical protein